MKIIHVTPYYSPAGEWGGPVRSVGMLAEATLRAGADVEVVTTNARGAAHLPQQPPGTHQVSGVPVTYCQVQGAPRRFFYSAGLAPALRRRLSGAHVVHIHGIFTYPAVAAARLCERHDVPYVLSPRGSLDPWALRQKRLKKAAYMLLLEQRTLLRAALLHFTAEDERRVAPPRYRDRPHAVVPNCVELDSLLRLDRAENLAPVPEVLILGRIHLMKGFDVLIPALRTVVDSGSPVRLVVAGNDEGGYRAKVEQLVSAHGLGECVSFLGEVAGEHKAAALRRAALLVAPSYRENFGMAIAEAMAAGLPVIVSDRVGIAPEIAECGAGLIVPVESRALADALVRLLCQPALRAAMGQRGREMVRARFSGPAVARAMLAAYERVRRRS